MPIWPFTMARFCCSRCSDPSVHDAPKHALDDPIAADKELFEAVILEARNIFEMEIKPDADKRLVEEVQELKDQGLTKAQIARRLGISANRMKTMF